MNRALEAPTDDGDIDLWRVLARVTERWLWVAASVVAFTGASAALAFLSTPIYRSSTVLVPADNKQNGGLANALGELGGLAAVAGLNLNTSSSDTQEALAVLKSRQFTERFIEDRGLLQSLFANKWDPDRHVWRVPPEQQPTLAKGFKYFDKKVRTASLDAKTGLVTLQIEWRDRMEAADWANELVSRLNVEMRERAIANANAAVSYLEQESNITSTVATREAIARLLETQVKQRMFANVTHEYAFRVVDKALPSDKDDTIRPKKLILVVSGFLVGAAVGLSVALLGGSRRKDGPRSAEGAGRFG